MLNEVVPTGQEVTTLDIVTLVVAIIGAVAGVGSIIWNVVSHLLSGGRARVTLKGAWLAGTGYATLPLRSFKLDQPQMPGARPMFVVDVASVGRLPISVNHWSIAVGDAAYGTVGGTPYTPKTPHRLDVGESAMWLVEAEEIAAMVEVMRSSKRPSTIRAKVALGDGREIVSKNGCELEDVR